ncbi:MAG: hypothetical protein PHH36_04505 [Sideroxydans sp.]|nr:hypothetical protein [Sideroxydans sp.]
MQRAQLHAQDVLQLFVTLLASLLLSFLLGNSLSWDAEIFKSSGSIFLATLAVVLTFYLFTQHLRSVAWGLVALSLLLGAGIFWQVPFVYFAVYPLGLWGGIRLFVESKQRLKLADFSAIIGNGILAACLSIGMLYNTVGFQSQKAIEALRITSDTLFHSAIAASIKNYGISAVGAHGLSEVPYYTASHAFFATISALSQQTVIETYLVLTPILLLPLCLAVFAFVTTQIHDNHFFQRYFAAYGSIALLMTKVFDAWGVLPSYFHSESYMLSLIFVALAMQLIMKRELSTFDQILLIGILFITANCKASSALMILGLLATRWAFFNRTKRDFFALFVSACVVLWFVSPVLTASLEHESNNSSREFWFFLKHWVTLRDFVAQDMLAEYWQILLFALLHFASGWFVILSRLDFSNPRSIVGDRITTFLLSAMVAAMAILAVTQIPGGGGYYFSNVVMWMSLPWFIPALVDQLAAVKSWHFFATTIIVGLLAGRIANQTREIPPGLPKDVAFFEQMYKIRDETPTDSVILVTKRDLTDYVHHGNKTQSCSMDAILFPAIAERAFVGVFNRHCNRFGYGLSSYFGDSKLLPAYIPDRIEVYSLPFAVRTSPFQD